MLQIIVHVWGDLYSDDYIDKFKLSIDQHTTVPWNLRVIRDHENGWGEYSKKHYRGDGEPAVVQGEGHANGYHNYNLGGLPLYKKMYPWMMDDHCKRGDVIMYMDIDMVINGDLKYFTTLKLNKPWVQYDYDICKNDLQLDYRNTNITPINTSVVVYKKGQLHPITDLVSKKPDQIFFTYRRVDAFVWYQFGVNNFFNYLPAEAVDWHYKDTDPIIRNMAGESIEYKDEVITRAVPQYPAPSPAPPVLGWFKRLIKW
jgi:hypothetical protein